MKTAKSVSLSIQGRTIKCKASVQGREFIRYYTGYTLSEAYEMFLSEILKSQ